VQHPFERADWTKRPRGGGFHITLFKPKSPVVLTVPDCDVLAPGTLRSLIRDSLTMEEFKTLL
jgi:hypothetical protein